MNKKKIKELQDIKKKTLAFQKQKQAEHKKIKGDLAAGISSLKKDLAKSKGAEKKKLSAILKKATKLSADYAKSVLLENNLIKKTLVALDKDIKALKSI